jgi:cyclic beta-1,2-glucan synthetase
MPEFRARVFKTVTTSSDDSNEEAIREELFSVERLEQYAGELSAELSASSRPTRGRLLLPRLEQNGRKLVAVYRALAGATGGGPALSPAAEWLVDNFHTVEEQLREIRRDLPRSYYKELPKIQTGELNGYPRVYAIALAIIAHTDSRLDSETLRRFVLAYQQVTPLSIGELWAIPITLRVALVENLRRLASRIIIASDARTRANRLADKILEMAAERSQPLVIEQAIGDSRRLDRAFLVQLTQRLRDQDPDVSSALGWIEAQLAGEQTTTEQIVHQEHQRQAAAQTTVGNIITSMRLLSTLDWRQFFESVCLVEPILAQDPAAAYDMMDFATRDRYRHALEKIAKRAKMSELEIAGQVVDLARRAQRHPGDARKSHIGYFLIDAGRDELEKVADYQRRPGERLSRVVLNYPTLAYLGGFAFLTASLLGLLLGCALEAGASPAALIWIGLLFLAPTSDLALSTLNRTLTSLFKPHLLPKMDTASGVPRSGCTFVVIPTMLTSAATVRGLLENLEVHFLANRDANIYFALLTDFADAPQAEMPEDGPLLDVAIDGIEELNARYGHGEEPHLYLFHRRRQWNPSEGCWIGWERKRGKLQEFNRLLRGARDTSYIVAAADPLLLSKVRYVITLDSDTQLPRDAARRLIGVALHPLNRPRFDKHLRRVTEGYGVLQPRVSMTLTSSSRSRFARIFSGHTGIDPYTAAVSDVYQDLFGEGIYTGKGLYDVDAFEAALAGRVPENTLLSHDLFEGLYARAALVTDVELLDDFPSRYDTYAKRQHRWTRGDWQIIRWLFPFVPEAGGARSRNTLPLIARWKIMDNLRRSLLAPSMLLCLVAAWTVLPGSAWLWTLAVVLALAFPVYAHVTNALLFHPRGIPWSSYFWSIWGDFRTNTAQTALSIIFLAHQAWLQSSAIAITLHRKLISHKRLLEWVTAAQADSSGADDSLWRSMWPAATISGVIALSILLTHSGGLVFALPFLLSWVASPVVAGWVGRTPTRKNEAIGQDDSLLARMVARRTWKFFETFVGPEDNWLAPDNCQEEPRLAIAHRTSPTNIGLLAISTAAAHDLGYVGTLELIERLESSFATMARLERFRGHFLNWYDTTTLRPLMPQYISTVDSGNLAGHLIALKQMCARIADEPLFDARTVEGMQDTTRLMQEELTRIEGTGKIAGTFTLKDLGVEIEGAAACLSAGIPQTLSAWSGLFKAVIKHMIEADDLINALSQDKGSLRFGQLRSWTGSLLHQSSELNRDLATLAPWAAVVPATIIAAGSLSGEPVPDLNELLTTLDRTPAVSRIPEICVDAIEKLTSAIKDPPDQGLAPETNRTKGTKEFRRLIAAMEQAVDSARNVASRYGEIADRSDAFMKAIDFQFLFDENHKLFVIGYNVTSGQRDDSFYDLLASESRLASFIAIAKGDVPQEHWFHLGRALVPAEGSRALVSWTGTMFEYLMPLLIMRGYADTLLDQTYNAVVTRQIEYGRERGVSWGISECAYNARDLQLNYQYGPFGIPGLGLKRGLGDDLVVSPYSTILAAMVEPRAALANVRRLIREGALGLYGLYESIDYTKTRLQPDQKKAIIKAFMVHHQGMSLVALDNLLKGNIMQARFHSDPLVQATNLLLQERIPRGRALGLARIVPGASYGRQSPAAEADPRHFDSADLPTPRTQLLSNGTYSVMVTTGGAGYSVFDRLAVTRWREDVTRDNWGAFCYLRNVASGDTWSAGYQPMAAAAGSYQVSLAEDKAEFWRSNAGIDTHTEIIVSPEDDVEVRRISITNNTARPAEIEVTSYAEIVLATAAADAAHPAFGNLFIETEAIASGSALLARRRRRSVKEDEVWGLHVIVTEGEAIGAVQYETDRARFLGRGHTTADPVAVVEGHPLSNTAGAVLDPIFSLRQRVRVDPGGIARVSLATGAMRSRAEAVALADKYHNPHAFDREAGLAWTKSQVEMRHLQMDANEAHLFQRLAGRLLYSDPSLRPRPSVLALNMKAQSGLWPYGISGDLPIALVRIGDEKDLDIVHQLLRGHEYLRLKGLEFDLVILNDHPHGYLQSLGDELQRVLRMRGSQALMDKPGGVFVRQASIMPEVDRILLHAVARVVIVTDRGPLEEQLVQRPLEGPLPEAFVPRLPARRHPDASPELPLLSFSNGLGGFTEGGREYAILIRQGQWTPAPWLNVVANPGEFGFQVSETGAGCTWSGNSRENRLTPWSNDPVSDPAGEAIYLRDEETGEVWSPTPLPIREPEPYLIRHGQGYSVFEHMSHGIHQDLTMFVPMDAPVKVSMLRLSNRSGKKRRLSVTYYAEWVLGFDRSRTAPYCMTEVDRETKSILARNSYNNEFAHRVAFASMSEPASTVTCDRKEFIGRNGSMASPAAMARAGLSGRVGAGLDPCVAAQAVIELAPGEGREIVLLLGQGESNEEARAIINQYKQARAARDAFEGVLAYWNDLLGAVQVKTPDAAMDIMVNRWLLYQSLSCRVWARSGFYQSSGAYGFRDQLQDACALVYSKPQIARDQILRAAGRQFKEGDVQHWWHPPTGRGVRTRFSDDLLWLPFITSFYIRVTGDKSVLEEATAFLDGPVLAQDQDEDYARPAVSAEVATVYEHCVRAIDRSLAVGQHGLPLMGSGDWNDGMNRVGHEGKGESIWVGWFLYSTLDDFLALVDLREDRGRGDLYREHLKKLKVAIEENGWDGAWYRRAYFDDGTPLGSTMNEECRIDSIVQSWAVISGAADKERAACGMAAVEEFLIRRGEGLVVLLTPPFDKSDIDPGYIKGYVPGVRENGGQYTHAALWVVIAYAMLGDGDHAGELFELLNPINHSSTRAGLYKYKVEPYVVAGDVYASSADTGRGGWTWYTGSASWMYRAALEYLLGLRVRDGRLQIIPCIPRMWKEYEIAYRYRSAVYHISVENPHGLSQGVSRVELDGEQLSGAEWILVDDGGNHYVHIKLDSPEENLV